MQPLDFRFNSVPPSRPPGESNVPRPTTGDMYHDVGMYRDKPFDESVGDLVRMLQQGRILGRTSKGAQVSADAGPTNWMQSSLTLRLKDSPDDQAGLYVDTNSPQYAHWYCTMGRGTSIPVALDRTEVLVNGDTDEAVAAHMSAVKQALEGAALQVPVRSIRSFLSIRFGEIASHLPADTAANLKSGLESSPLWAQKAVGDMAARRGDDGVAEFYRFGAGEALVQAQSRVAALVDEVQPGQGQHAAHQFEADMSGLSEAEQMILAERFHKPYTYATESAADAFIAGTGLAPIIDEARRSV